MLLGAIHVRRITPINSSYRSDVPLDERDIILLIRSYAVGKRKGLNIPLESLPTADQKTKADKNHTLKGDEINPNRLNTMLLMILSSAVK